MKHGGARPNSGGARPNSGGPRPNSGGARPNSGPKRIVFLPPPEAGRWYCAHTRYASESDAADAISAAGFEVFAPTIWEAATRARRNAEGARIPAKEAGVGPLFRTYIFARFRISDFWQQIRDMPSIDTILGLAPDAPTAMPERAIELIRGMCDANGCFHEAGDAPNSMVGKLLRMMDGPMTSFEGPCDWSDGQRVRVLLSIFGRPCPIIVDQDAVEAV